GYDIIFVETVGGGQSEVAVRGLTDLFMLLMLPNAGDSLQGIKRGIMELADLIVINKADSDNQNAAMLAKQEIEQALSFMRSATPGWKVLVDTCSALYSENIKTVWSKVEDFQKSSGNTISGSFKMRRIKQVENWLMDRLNQRILTDFYTKENVINHLPKYRDSFLKGEASLESTLEKILRLNS
ncbi:MAG: methylmalonyl Co-A mutase-associated GTPase MeaB, partial [Deltaproteobacteria bacterium]|nr:methylmalonyl Co-A mutase-associated GTPase MeaB [Deltaproteobacteria bacterium]